MKIPINEEISRHKKKLNWEELQSEISRKQDSTCPSINVALKTQTRRNQGEEDEAEWSEKNKKKSWDEK